MSELRLLATPPPEPTEYDRTNCLLGMAPQHWHFLKFPHSEHIEYSRKRIAETLALAGATWPAVESTIREMHARGKLKNVPNEEALANELAAIYRIYAVMIL